MFRHKENNAEAEKELKAESLPGGDKIPEAEPENKAKYIDTSPGALRELMEKNLKWSQIIYEQNRRINSKLFWQSFFGWLKAIAIIAAIVLPVWYAWPFVREAYKQYNSLVGNYQAVSNPSPENFLNALPLSEEKKAQIKEMLK